MQQDELQKRLPWTSMFGREQIQIYLHTVFLNLSQISGNFSEKNAETEYLESEFWM